ncbi:GNAT family N-acetyltransferase [Agreia sp. PsM10]|uniref:GNAT family N-acetyltransferase n=1 Tax=Agreia sp. PsM10 TaxID=3030533 RepID=UPI00263AC1DE|nr:GNAT family N-acetyltransferase [Agreia sp. PsM10]MDN4639867.1 GNAT family N-acetyltransferase [Agreia sp. PsM10]
MLTLDDVWPLFGLRLRTPRLELRLMRDDDLPAVVEAVLAGIHPADRMPFDSPWTDAEPEQLARDFAKYHWHLRTTVQPGTWTLDFVVLHEGRVIGMQDVRAENLARTKTISSGSWLTRSAQGQGFGTEMRAAILLFAFDHLAVEAAESSAATWNESSLGVSHRLGYLDDGQTEVEPRPGERNTMQKLRLERENFARPDWSLDVHGAAAAQAELLRP